MAFHLGAPLETSKTPDPKRLPAWSVPKQFGFIGKMVSEVSSRPHLTQMPGARDAPQPSCRGFGWSFTRPVCWYSNHAFALQREASNFPFPLPRLRACLELAEREKPEWEQSRQQQSKRGRFRDGSGATASSSTSNRSGWYSASADHHRAAATRCDRQAAAQTAGAGQAGVGDGVVAGKGHVTS
jgi:hypothetical protein